MFEAGGVACRPWPEQEEGPYHRHVPPFRRDVAEDRTGTPLQVGIRLLCSDGEPLVEAVVEIWHCDALGRYSGFAPPDPALMVTAESALKAEVVPGETFLRGRQSTDAAGIVEFATIYPGWYQGRTVHIHVMAHTHHTAYTTQLYFPEGITAEVFANPPYNQRPGPDTTNDTDEIFLGGGERALLEIRPAQAGYRAAVCFVVPSRSGTMADWFGAARSPLAPAHTPTARNRSGASMRMSSESSTAVMSRRSAP